jgi:hypothetical protein
MSGVFNLGVVVLGGLGEVLPGRALIIEAALAAAEDGALDSALIAFAVFLEAFGLLALAALLDSLGLHPQAEALGLWQILAVVVNEAMDIPGECINDGLLVFLLVGGVVAAGVAVAALRAEELFLEALAVELEASGAFAVAAHLLIRHRHLLRLLLIY